MPPPVVINPVLVNNEVVNVPVKVGDAKLDFKFNAVVVAVDTGLFKSDVSSTLDKPIIDFVIPLTVPVKVGDAKFDFKFNAVCVVVDTGFNKSVVLSTLDKPTIALVIPFVVPVSVMPPDAIDNIGVVEVPLI